MDLLRTELGGGGSFALFQLSVRIFSCLLQCEEQVRVGQSSEDDPNDKTTALCLVKVNSNSSGNEKYI